MFRKVVFVAAIMLGLVFADGFSIRDSKRFASSEEGIFVNATAVLLPNENGEQPVNYQLLSKHYIIGRHQGHDRLVHTARKNLLFHSPHDVDLHLTYPPSHENGRALLTYIEILVHQTSQIGRAFIYSGGLHQDHITITVEAKHTYSIDYTAYIYGI